MAQSKNLAVTQDADLNGRSFDGQLGLVNYNPSHQPTEKERDVKDKLAGQLAEIDATALKEYHADNLIDQMHVNDQRGFRDATARILEIRNSAESEEHAAIMAKFTDANINDLENTKRKLTNVAEYSIAKVVEESVRPAERPTRRGLWGWLGG